jgi:hypothetical protein
MIRDLLNKASHSAKAARALVEGDAPDDAVNRGSMSSVTTSFCPGTRSCIVKPQGEMTPAISVATAPASVERSSGNSSVSK